MGFESGKWSISSVHFLTLRKMLEQLGAGNAFSASAFPQKRAFGTVLDVGARISWYKKWFAHDKWLTLDIDAASKPDVLGDICKIPLDDSSVDSVFCISVLEHVYDVNKAVSEIFRVLRAGGQAVVAIPFLHPYHADPHDYWRFTRDSLSLLFAQFGKIEIYPHGNRFHTLWSCLAYGKLAYIFGWLNPLVAKIGGTDDKFPTGYVVVAKK